MTVRFAEDAVRIVVRSAERYERELNQKDLLLICMDRHKRISTMELTFFGANFLRLTGLKLRKTKPSEGEPIQTAQLFYERCLAHRLGPEDFEDVEGGLTDLRLTVLPYIICKNLMANSIGDFEGKGPRLFTERLDVGQKACIGLAYDRHSHKYVPNTLLSGDIPGHITNPRRIIAIFRKPAGNETYEEITHLAKKTDWNNVSFPAPYEPLRRLILSAAGDPPLLAAEPNADQVRADALSRLMHELEIGANSQEYFEEDDVWEMLGVSD